MFYRYLLYPSLQNSLTSIFVVLWGLVSLFAIRFLIRTTRVRVRSLAHFCPQMGYLSG